MPKYFVSAILPTQRIGAMQFEAANDIEMREKAETMCPYRACFKSYVIDEFDEGTPIDEFLPESKMDELGY